MTDERCIYMEAVDEIESLKTLLLMQIAAGISHEKSLIKEIALGRLMEWAEKENVVTYG
jgi:hypothetical protein